MRIALIGDYSGVHLSLKKGFELLGYETNLYSDGDGFKKIRSNKALNHLGTRKIDKIQHYLYELPALLKKISLNYDAIQIINPHVISSVKNSPAYYGYLMSILKNSDGIKSLAVVGCEKNTQRGLSTMSRSPCPGCMIDHGLPKCPLIDKKNTRITEYAIDCADVIIPFGGPSYSASYSHIKKAAVLHPFPVDTSVVQYFGNRLEGKIRVLHGVSRVGFKGTSVIMEALLKILDSFPEHFEIIRVEKLPFDEYLKLLPTVNVVIDQLYGDALGMNALLSMAAGCVLFTSFERVKEGEVNLIDVPAIKLGLTSDEIFSQIADLRAWSARDFDMIGDQSRQYVLNHCSPINVAGRVIETWRDSKSTERRLSKGGV